MLKTQDIYVAILRQYQILGKLMKKLLLAILFSVSIISFANEQNERDNDKTFCVEFKRSHEYSFSGESLKLFCGKSGKKVFSKFASSKKKKTEAKQELNKIKKQLSLQEFDKVQFESDFAFKVYSKDSATKVPRETIIVFTKNRLKSWSFNKEKIGYLHRITTNDFKSGEISDDLNKTVLLNYLSENGFTHIVKAYTSNKPHKKTINVYVKY